MKKFDYIIRKVPVRTRGNAAEVSGTGTSGGVSMSGAFHPLGGGDAIDFSARQLRLTELIFGDAAVIRYNEQTHALILDGVDSSKPADFASRGDVSALGLGSGEDWPGSVSALYKLVDVIRDGEKVKGAVPGASLVYDGTKWYAEVLQSGLDESALKDYLNKNEYVTKAALADYALVTSIPTKLSSLNNDVGFVTSSELSAYAFKNGSNASGTWDIDISGTSDNALKLGSILATSYYHSGNSNRSDVDWTCRTLRIGSTLPQSHIAFSRENINYFSAPTTGYFGFVSNGKSLAQSYADLIIREALVAPGTNIGSDLGSSTLRWKSLYAQYADFSGNVGIANVRIRYDAPSRTLIYEGLDGEPVNIAATGDVSALGVAESGGGVSYNRLDEWTDYSADKTGWVLSAKLGVDLNTRLMAVESGQVELVWKNITGKPTTLAGYGITDAYTKSYIDTTIAKKSEIPTSLKNPYALTWSGLSSGEYDGSSAKSFVIPTTLPASDVYAWAKAATKPSYTFAEIGSKPTTLSGYGITDAYTKDGADGRYMQKYILVNGLDMNDIKSPSIYYGYNMTNSALASISTFLVTRYSNDWGTQMQFLPGEKRAYIRFWAGAGGVMDSKWKQFAFTDSNVESANKLATPRSLWGNSFDGTKDIDGNMTNVGSITMNKGRTQYMRISGTGSIAFNASSTGHWARDYSVHNAAYEIDIASIAGAYGNKDELIYTYYGGTYTNPFMRILPDGKVGILKNPTEALDVNGNIKATNFIGNLQGNAIGLYNLDERDLATKPTDYVKVFKFIGIKSNTILNLANKGYYSYLFGFRGWIDNSAGYAWEKAYNNYGIFVRRAVSTTEWGGWNELYHSGNSNKSDVDWTCQTLTIGSQIAEAHLAFSRANINCLTAPSSGYFGFITNGKSLGLSYSDLIVKPNLVAPGANLYSDLGSEALRWKSLYAQSADFSGFIKIGNAKVRYNAANKTLVVEGADGSVVNFSATGDVMALSAN